MATTVATAQTWQAATHNGYQCRLLNSPDNQRVLAAKTTDALGNDVLHVKFRIPYQWGDMGTACVKITQTDLLSGQKKSGDTHLSHKNGWIYITQYMYQNRPSFTCVVKVYENNDFGVSTGPSQVYNLNLQSLDTARMPINDVMDLYW